jgi:hypothetical protein
MEDDLKKMKLDDDLNFVLKIDTRRRPNFFENGRRPHFYLIRRRPKKNGIWIFKNNFSIDFHFRRFQALFIFSAKIDPPGGQGVPQFFFYPKSYIFCDLKPHAKFRNPTITPSGKNEV